MSAAPRAQLNPTLIGSACIIEYQNASAVWPVRVRPLRSVMVPEIMIGREMSCCAKNCFTAKIAALALRVSNTVSIRMMSDPPSINPRTESV